MKEEKRIVIVTEDEEQLIELACVFLRHGKSNLELYSDAAFIRDPQTIDRMIADGRSEAYLPAVSGVTFVLKKENFGESTANVTGRIYMDGNSMAEELYEKMETCVQRLQEMETEPEQKQEIEAEPEQRQEIDAEPESEAEEQTTAVTETRLYLATSPVGGAGKTEGTILLGKLLAQQGKRVFYINMEEELPGPLVFTTDEVIDTIKHMDEITEKYAERYVTFYDKFCGWEDGHSSQRVVETVFEKN